MNIPKEVQDTELPSKLQLQNEAWHEIVRKMETAINGVKAPDDKYRTKEFLDGLQNDLGTIMNLHYGNLNIKDGYISQRKQSDKLYKKCKALEAEGQENANNTGASTPVSKKSSSDSSGN